MTTHNINGATVTLDVPDDAVVTGAIIVVSYQRIDDGREASGVHFRSSPIPHYQAVGMMRLATNAIEKGNE